MDLRNYLKLEFFHTKCEKLTNVWNFHTLRKIFTQGHDLLKGCVISSISEILVPFKSAVKNEKNLLCFEKIVTGYDEILGPICAWAWYKYNEDYKPDLCCFCLSLKGWHLKEFWEHFFKILTKPL